MEPPQQPKMEPPQQLEEGCEQPAREGALQAESSACEDETKLKTARPKLEPPQQLELAVSSQREREHCRLKA